MCRANFAPNDILQASDLNIVCDSSSPAPSQQDDARASHPVHSAKIRALIHALQTEWASDSSQKAVVFSQFTSMLDLTAAALEAAFGPQCCARLVGSMTPDQRAAQISRFSVDSPTSPRILLCSLKASSTGINLCRANLVFLLDVW
jgi:SNF2 family DNA or RNA helicase